MKRLLLGIYFSVLFAACSVCASEQICLEAEWASSLEKPMKLVDTANHAKADDATVEKASEKGYLEIAQSLGKSAETNGAASYSITVESAGRYVVWIRAWWLDSCGNSVSLTVNKNRPVTVGQDGSYKVWHWVKSRASFDLEAGENTIVIANREDGIRIDQIFITDSKRVVPVGIEDTTIAAPAGDDEK